MAVQIDEPRRGNTIRDVEHATTLQRGGADRSDGTPVDADVADRIESGFGVDYPSSVKH